MKILVVGCGSMGARHARNAKQLGAGLAFCDSSLDRLRSLERELDVHETYVDLDAALQQSHADAVVIASPSHLHATHATIAANHGVGILMEKPLCANLEEARTLESLVIRQNIVFMMAHTYRFRSEWQEVKSMLEKSPIGRVYSAEFAGGWFLPDWHIGQDYRVEYAAQQRQAGGVLLTSMSHFFDIVAWFFGDISRLMAAKMRLSDLEIDVDDSFVGLALTEQNIAVTLIEDFLSPCPRRSLRVNGDKGYLEADFHRRTLTIWDSSAKRFVPGVDVSSKSTSLFRILEGGVEYDLQQSSSELKVAEADAYVAEMVYFLELLALAKSDSNIGIGAGVKVIENLSHLGILDWTTKESV